VHFETSEHIPFLFGVRFSWDMWEFVKD